MKISPSQVSKALGVYNSQKASGSKRSESSKQVKDEVTISNTAQSFQLAFKAVKESPDVRAAKVDEIKARIAEGTYKVSSSDIAEKILQNSTFNKKV